MAGAIIGGVLGMVFGPTLAAWGIVASAGLGWIAGAAIGSLFDQPTMDFGSSSPNYSFGPLSNTKSQLLPVPIVYGRVRMAGNVFLQKFYSDKREKMDMFVGLSHGPINRIINVYANEHVLYGDGSATYTYWTLSGSEWAEVSYAEYLAFEGTKQIRDADGENVVTVDLQECSCDVHLGEATQPIDDREPGTENYAGIAYVAITLKVQEGLSGNPVITTEIEGRKVWTPAGERYTNNPIWCCIDLLTNEEYGVGLPIEAIDLTVAADSAAYCDQLVDGKPRYTLNYIIDRQRPATDILRDMLMCCDGYIREREQIQLCVNKPVSSPIMAIDTGTTAGDIIEGSFHSWGKSREEILNRVVVEWVDPENHYERTSYPFEDSADMLNRGVYERNISLLGVTCPYQAGRLGEKALRMSQDVREFCEFRVSVNNWDMEVGDVIAITDENNAWSSKWFHVLSMEDDAATEECTVICSEYQSSTYVNTPTIVPDTPDNPDPDPATDNYSNLILTDVGTQQEDGTYIPKIQAQYTPPSTDMKEHVINWWHEGEAVSEKKVSPQVKDVLLSDGIQTGVVLTVRVWGTDLNGKPRSGVIGQITPGKDSVAPGAPTSLTATGWFGEILLDWVNPETNEDGTPCTDLSHVEVWESSEDDVETSVLVGKVNGTHFQRHLGSFEGRYYWVRAVDTSGNMSQWNAEAGTFGYSEQESHEDFINALLEQNPLIKELWDHLGEEVDGVSEERIKDMLGSLDQFYLLMFQQRQAEKDAEALIEEALGNYQDMKYSVAIVNEEKITRESEDEALAQSIEVVGAMIGDPNNPGADTVWAGIYEEKTARATADEAMAEHILDISAGIGDPLNPEDGTVYAAIRKEAQARATGDEASATEIDTLYSQLGSTNAAIQNESITRAAQDSALSSQISTVQNTVGENTTKIQQSATVIDGIKGEWTVKIDSNGSVAGIGLINGPTGSAFIVRSDSFWIGRPGTTIKEAPFVVGTVDGITKVSMSNAFIQDAAISSAKIKDLTIGRIKLASGIDAGLSWGEEDSNMNRYDDPGGTFRNLANVSIPTDSRGRVLINAFCTLRYWNSSYRLALYRNGSPLYTIRDTGGGEEDPFATHCGFYVDKYPGNGYQNYSIRVQNTGSGTVQIIGSGICAIAFYR